VSARRCGGIEQDPAAAGRLQARRIHSQERGRAPAEGLPELLGWPAEFHHQRLPELGQHLAMARQAGATLIEGQQLLLGIEGLVMDGHRLNPTIGQGGDQGLPIEGPTQGGHGPPAPIDRIEPTAIGHQVPPMDAGRRWI